MHKLISKREKLTFYAAIFIILFSFIFNLIISPLTKKNHTLNQKITVTKEKIKKYRALISKKDFIQNDFDKFPHMRAGKGELISSPDALSELKYFADDAGILIKDIRPQFSKNKSVNKEMNVELKSEGLLDEHLKFIYNLEKSLSLFTIKRFQINASNKPQKLEGNYSITKNE